MGHLIGSKTCIDEGLRSDNKSSGFATFYSSSTFFVCPEEVLILINF